MILRMKNILSPSQSGADIDESFREARLDAVICSD
jgi:hypothetical protein